MNVKKILLTSLFAGTLMLTACGGGGGEDTTGADLSGEYDVTLWVSEVEGVTDLTTTQIRAFEAANPGIVIKEKVVGLSEADSATTMLTDVSAGADIYCFAQDQFARLVQGGALSKLGEGAAKIVTENNDAGAVGAVTSGTALYAYPLTSDNGYYMYYDKSVITDESHLGNLEQLIADCESAGRNFSFEAETSGWYLASWFFGTGCVSEWTTDSTGAFTAYNDTFNSDKGVIAAKGMKKLLASSSYVSSSSADDFSAGVKSAIVVSGTWAYDAAKRALGDDNLGAAELPSFTVDGTSYHLGSYSGNKLMGVKPQTNATKSAVMHKLAQFLTDKDRQLERFTAVGWGPSNLEAQQNEAVQASPTLSALQAQNVYAKNQGPIPGAWWDISKVIATGLKTANTDVEIKAVLEKYAKNLEEIVNPTEAPKWGLIGSFNDWTENVDFEEQGDGKWVLEYEFAADDEFKVRLGADWDTAIGYSEDLGADFTGKKVGDNIVVVNAGKYRLTVTPDAASTSGTLAITALL